MTIRGFLLLGALLFLTGAACPAGPRSGIEGRSVIGPTRPVQRVDDEPDPTPYPTTLQILAADRHPVARVTTGPDGRFRIDLPPGEYWVTGSKSAGRFRPQAPEERVEVLAGKMTSVTLRFDSGLR